MRNLIVSVVAVVDIWLFVCKWGLLGCLGAFPSPLMLEWRLLGEVVSVGWRPAILSRQYLQTLPNKHMQIPALITVVCCGKQSEQKESVKQREPPWSLAQPTPPLLHLFSSLPHYYRCGSTVSEGFSPAARGHNQHWGANNRYPTIWPLLLSDPSKDNSLWLYMSSHPKHTTQLILYSPLVTLRNREQAYHYISTGYFWHSLFWCRESQLLLSHIKQRIATKPL